MNLFPFRGIQVFVLLFLGSICYSAPTIDPATISSSNESPFLEEQQRQEWLGVSDADVEDLVQQVIRDPSINIASVPDALEIHVYRSTIRVVLNALYELLGKLHGAKIANTDHEVQLKRLSVAPRIVRRKKIRKHYEKRARATDIRDDILEEIALGLLSNRNINQRFLPDAIEKRLYMNCLKLIFRLLEIIADSIKITVCGHDLRIAMSPASVELAMEHATLRLAEVDRSRLYEMAKSVGLDETQKAWWLNRKRQAFLQTLHASLLALLLAILDDLMHRTCIELFSDRMVLDIVPSVGTPGDIKDFQVNVTSAAEATNGHNSNRLIPFIAGIGVGVAFSSKLWSSDK